MLVEYIRSVGEMYGEHLESVSLGIKTICEICCKIARLKIFDICSQAKEVLQLKSCFDVATAAVGAFLLRDWKARSASLAKSESKSIKWYSLFYLP